MPALYQHKISIAPMMDWTDRHCRYFHRQLTRNTLLYTEMVTTGAILHGDPDRFLKHHPEENPLALQLGGNEPEALAACSKIALRHGYDEINLNVGCPSDRVQSGQFGACLMLKPELVARCVDAMSMAVDIPVTVKCRLGVDHNDDYEFLHRFIQQVSNAGGQAFIIHARKAWLSGLSPKQNREIPPLDYNRVYQVKQDFPHLTIIINGGITSHDAIETHLKHVDGVMIGREAYQNPFFLSTLDQQFYGSDTPSLSRKEALSALYPYIQEELINGILLKSITRHLLGLFNKEKGARAWRRHLSTQAHKALAGLETLKIASDYILDTDQE